MTSHKVQIICICYNQAQFIAQALESFVMQKTNFSFEAIVVDDCSTDNSADIILDYQKKYPHIIKPVFHDENIGAMRNFIYALNCAQAEFIAFCEGDDYWTDPYKLQKQVDALEANQSCTVCFHSVAVHWEDGSKEDNLFPSPEFLGGKTQLSFFDLAKSNFIQTNSVLYRWLFSGQDIGQFMPLDILPGDWLLHLLHAQYGDILYLEDTMAVYRKWHGGLWAGAGETEEWFCRCGIPQLKFFHHLKQLFMERYVLQVDVISALVSNIKLAATRQGRSDVLQELEPFYSMYFPSRKLYETSMLPPLPIDRKLRIAVLKKLAQKRAE